MSTPAPGQPQAPPLDTGNTLLSEVPATLSCVPVNGPGGQRLALTIRTQSTTLTVFLVKDDAQRWRDVISEGVGNLVGLIIPASSVNGNG